MQDTDAVEIQEDTLPLIVPKSSEGPLFFKSPTFEDARPPKAERSATPPQLSGERRGAASGSFGGAVQNTVIHFRRRGAASGSFGGAVQNIVVRFRRPKHLFHMGRG